MTLIVVKHAGEEVFRRRMDQSTMTIGRSAESDVYIDNRALSRTHARLERRSGRLVIRDLGSQNGTFVNGSRIKGTAVVRPGDRIEIGNHVVELLEEDPALRPPDLAPREMLAVISVSAPGTPAATFALLADTIVLGRADDVDISLPSAKISRRHAELRRAGGFFIVSDLGSQNGIYIDRKRIDGPRQIRPGDSFFIEPFTLTVDEREVDEDEGLVDEGEFGSKTAIFLGNASDFPMGANRDQQLAAWQQQANTSGGVASSSSPTGQHQIATPVPNAPPPKVDMQVLAPNPTQHDAFPPGLEATPPPLPHDATSPDGWGDPTSPDQDFVDLPNTGTHGGARTLGLVNITMVSGQVLEIPMVRPLMTLGDTKSCDVVIKAGDYPTGPSLVLVAAADKKLALVHLGRGQAPVVGGLESAHAMLESGETAIMGPMEISWVARP